MRRKWACRPVPDDASLTLSDSLGDPGEIVAQAVRDLKKGGSLQGWGSDAVAVEEATLDPNVQVNVAPVDPPSLVAGTCATRACFPQTSSSPVRGGGTG